MNKITQAQLNEMVAKMKAKTEAKKVEVKVQAERLQLKLLAKSN